MIAEGNGIGWHSIRARTPWMGLFLHPARFGRRCPHPAPSVSFAIIRTIVMNTAWTE